MQQDTIINKGRRPGPPTLPIQCPWCSEQSPMKPGRLSQHVHNSHPKHWKGSIYASLPADFDYGNGPLDPAVRDLLITYSGYSAKRYARLRRQKSSGRKVKPYRRLTTSPFVYNNEMEQKVRDSLLARVRPTGDLESRIIERVAELIYNDMKERNK